MYTLEDLFDEVNIMLTAFRVAFKKVTLGGKHPNVFVVDSLGIAVACIFPEDYSFILGKLENNYKNFRFIFVTTSDNLYEKKDSILWEFMRSGYIRYIRLTYPRQFNDIIHQGFGRKIIAERLRIWGDKAMYKYLIEENKQGLNAPIQVLLNYDPSFFDYMPEEKIGVE